MKKMSKDIADILRPKPNLLNIDDNELKSIKVALRRNNVSAGPQPHSLHRMLDDPKSLRVNLFGNYLYTFFTIMHGVPGRTIFYRGDVLVNLHELTEEQFYSVKSESVNIQEPQPGTSSQSQNTRSFFGGYINKPVPFDESSKEDSYRRYQHSKSSRRSRSRSRSSSSHKRTSRHSRSSSVDRRHKERVYGKKSYSRKHSPPLRPGEYRPKRRLRSSSRSPESHRRYRSRDDSNSPENRRRKAAKRCSKSYSPDRSPTYKSKGYYRKSKSPDYYRSSKRHHESNHKERRSFSRERNVTRLRPGEYRPPRNGSPSSTPLRPGEYRPKQPAYPVIPLVPETDYIYSGFAMQHPVRFIYVPPPMRPPFPMMNRYRPPRPHIQYNTRGMPKFVPTKEGNSNSDNKNDCKKNESDSEQK